MLELADVTVRFGGVTAVSGVSLDVASGSVCGLIGPNGAGKTTLFNCISRLVQPVSGSIRFGGRDLLSAPPHRLAESGVARTFQNLGLFPGTVSANVAAGCGPRGTGGFLASALGLRGPRRAARADADRARAALAEVGLDGHADHDVGALPYGTRKRVELARALAADPELLLLDEPAGGLSHSEVDELGALLRAVRDRRRLTMVIVEHHMGFVDQLCDVVVVLQSGSVLSTGTVDEVRADERVVRAYLGGTR